MPSDEMDQPNPENAGASISAEANTRSFAHLPSLVALYDYWIDIRKDRIVPDAQDVDPLAIVPLLPDIVVFQVNSPEEIIYRLAGTEVVNRMGHDPTGKNLIDIAASGKGGIISTLMTMTVRQPAGLYARYDNIYTNGRRATVNSLYLPVSDDSDTLGRILAIHTMSKPKLYEEERSLTTIGDSIELTEFLDIGAGTPDI
jgi:hypothetical protein